MTLLRRGLARVALIGALLLGGAAGCASGAPERASDIQNLNAISDDIAAVTMTQSPTSRPNDPNRPTIFPRSNQSSYSP
jgi:hypothetical protein